MALVQAPCKGCVPPVRHMLCHKDCKQFKDYEEAKEKEKELIRKGKLAETQHIALMKENKDKRMRQHR